MTKIQNESVIKTYADLQPEGKTMPSRDIVSRPSGFISQAEQYCIANNIDYFLGLKLFDICIELPGNLIYFKFWDSPVALLPEPVEIFRNKCMSSRGYYIVVFSFSDFKCQVENINKII